MGRCGVTKTMSTFEECMYYAVSHCADDRAAKEGNVDGGCGIAVRVNN